MLKMGFCSLLVCLVVGALLVCNVSFVFGGLYYYYYYYHWIFHFGNDFLLQNIQLVARGHGGKFQFLGF